MIGRYRTRFTEILFEKWVFKMAVALYTERKVFQEKKVFHIESCLMHTFLTFKYIPCAECTEKER